MRSLQNVFLFVGATALGSAWGGIAIALIGALTVFRARSGEDWGTVFGVIFSGACLGMPLGAVAGIAAARVIASDESDDWGPIVWIGVALGVAVGLASCYFGVSNLRFDLIGALIVVIGTAMFGAIGGLLAATAEGLWRRASRGRSLVVGIVLGLLFVFIASSLVLAMASMAFSSRLTGFQLAVAFLIGVPILCGLIAWLRYDGKRRRRRKRANVGKR